MCLSKYHLIMSQVANDKDFRPWVSNLVLAIYGFVTILIAYHFLYRRGHLGGFAVALAVCGLFTVYQWKQFIRRAYGQRVESRAIKALEKALSRVDGTAIEKGVMLPFGGDADAVVEIAGVKFNIEIKSITSPQKITIQNTTQARKAGGVLFSIPVVWLPRAKSREAREKNDVRIFAGDAKSLVKYLRAIK